MTTPGAADGAERAGGKTLNILMLHGYTQSGPQFHAKTAGLEKFLIKTLAASSIAPKLIYPTAPHRLLLSTLSPSFQDAVRAERQGSAGDGGDGEGNHWAWFRKDDATGTYLHLEEGMTAIANAIERAGGIHAVCGFSQGGATTAFVASALEPSRPLPAEDTPAGSWARKLRLANRNQPLKFAIVYSGFWAPPDNLQWLYEPKITTPTMHFIGSLDTLVDESRSRALAEKCETSVVVVHPGAHFVPIAKTWTLPVAAFIAEHAKDKSTAAL